MPVKAALNAVVRFSVYLSLLLTATSRDVWYLLLIPLVMGVTIVLSSWFPNTKKIMEGFQSGPVVSGYSGTETSMPSDVFPAYAVQKLKRSITSSMDSFGSSTPNS
jgi:hypothetical protein